MARSGRIGWFVGLLTGAIMGVLFAPHKGKELRDRMKAERKKGKLGVAPLKDDMQELGQELAGLAMDIYNSKSVKDIVEKGRGKIQELSRDFVNEVSDFHVTRIKPHASRARREVKGIKRKVETGLKIGKKAIKDITKEMKKEP